MIESPCIGVCTIIRNKCIGCLRTNEEINNWLYFSDEERRKITKKCLKNMKINIKKRKSIEKS